MEYLTPILNGYILIAFGGPTSTRGNTGPFWVGSALAVLSAIITITMIRPLSHDGMVKEDEDVSVCLYSEILPFLINLVLSSAHTWRHMDMIPHKWVSATPIPSRRIRRRMSR